MDALTILLLKDLNYAIDNSDPSGKGIVVCVLKSIAV